MPGWAPAGTVAATVPLVSWRVAFPVHIGVPFQEKVIAVPHG
ncbi:hypothetical protein QRX60_21685 [Amycolatopsis mongoliensis]|uniref:Uncharacterized protein n=1 Tax=Amycolatopsis mongoliensis TaxID=715475 RepID=A0A9Y2JX50_9PSEU|nr:hypothetical protein [Amycolatopsis sp. 4-36]WIY06328.1 hypothetical protein QRX60_21685 [Amycolatopsis sp. 4-36]